MAECSSGSLKDQVAVITGAGRGIGAAIAAKLADLGAITVLCGRKIEPLEATAKEILKRGDKAEVMVCDVTSLESVKEAAEKIGRTYSRVNILVNNAGVRGVPGPLHELPPDSWDDVFNTNLRGVFFAIRSFVPLMIKSGGGHIVNISSLAGKNALPNGAAYSASKWGLNGLSYSAAEELRTHKIRVSLVCPGSVNTEFSPHSGKSADRMLQPDDIAHAVAMLVTQAPRSFISEILLRPTEKP